MDLDTEKMFMDILDLLEEFNSEINKGAKNYKKFKHSLHKIKNLKDYITRVIEDE